jgi:hypothetical protein
VSHLHERLIVRDDLVDATAWVQAGFHPYDIHVRSPRLDAAVALWEDEREACLWAAGDRRRIGPGRTGLPAPPFNAESVT